MKISGRVLLSSALDREELRSFVKNYSSIHQTDTVLSRELYILRQ